MSSSQETTTESLRLTGKVKWFNNKAGFGFITVCDGEHAGKDIFVHYSSIRGDDSLYKYLVQGEYVDFDLVKSTSDKHEYHAVNISGIKSGTIMCETRKLSDNGARPRTTVRKYKTRPQRQSEPAAEGQVDADADAGFEKVEKKRQPRQPRA
jgi:CspA family cold shock protein